MRLFPTHEPIAGGSYALTPYNPSAPWPPPANPTTREVRPLVCIRIAVKATSPDLHPAIGLHQGKIESGRELDSGRLLLATFFSGNRAFLFRIISGMNAMVRRSVGP